jgi:hypothetical protein
VSSPFKPGDPLFNRSPGHREVIGASPFWRRVAGMRDRGDHDRHLHARGGESARVIGSAGSLSPGPFGAETGETGRRPFNRNRDPFYRRRENTNTSPSESAARRRALLLANLGQRC